MTETETKTEESRSREALPNKNKTGIKEDPQIDKDRAIQDLEEKRRILKGRLLEIESYLDLLKGRGYSKDDRITTKSDTEENRSRTKEDLIEELVVEESKVEEREDLEYAKEDKYLEMEPEEFKFSRGDVVQYKENQGHGNIDRTKPRVVIKEHPDSEADFRVVSVHRLTDSGYWTYGTIPQHKLEKVGEVERVPKQRETSSLEDLGYTPLEDLEESEKPEVEAHE